MKRCPSSPTRETAPGAPVGEFASFFQNILESSTEYSTIGKDLDGNILLWNEGARRLYGYEPGDPCILYSNTFASDSSQHLALEFGADLFLKKPAPPVKILAADDTAADSPRNRSQPTPHFRESSHCR